MVDFNTKTLTDMTGNRQREIVIEFEKVQTTRRRARTHLLFCEPCGDFTDQVPLAEAATLFEITPEDLLHFVTHNGCHSQIAENKKVSLCLVSLLDELKKLDNTRRLTAMGENNEGEIPIGGAGQ